MPKNWRYLPFDQGRISDLTHAMRISPVLAQVLCARGYENEADARLFLTTKLTDLHEPELLPGVPEGVDRILAAIQEKRRITIYGDYDVDGVTSTSLLWNCLKLAGAQVDYYIPNRLDEGYGLNSDAIRSLAEEDASRLLLTVDCGITSVAEAALARELGMELIISDHHQFSEKLPEALLIHPRLPGGDYPFGELCGVGVAFKLAWALCKKLGDGRKAPPAFKEFLLNAMSFAALGTIADVVPLTGENRVIVRFGLGSLRERCSLGMKALLQIAGVWDKPDIQAEDIGFAVGPRLNAVGRLGQARLAVELLTTENPERALKLAEYIDSQNKVRQSVERKILKQAKELVEQHPEWLDQSTLVIAHHEWHPGVIGIVASRVAELYEKPTVLIALNQSENTGQGSGRSFAGFNLHAGLTACSEHLIQFGGHHAAAGLRISGDSIPQFREALQTFANGNHEVNERDLEVVVDTEVRLADLTLQAVSELDRLGPFGRENPRPVFAASDVQLTEPPRKIGEGGRHLSLSIRQSGHRMRAICFGRADWADEIAAQKSLTLCFAPSLNHFRGQTSVDLQLIDWRGDEGA